MYQYSLMFYDRFEDRWVHSGKFPQVTTESSETYLNFLKDFTNTPEGARSYHSNRIVFYKVFAFIDQRWEFTLKQGILKDLLKKEPVIVEIET